MARKKNSQMRRLGTTVLGGAMVGTVTPLMSNRSPAALTGAAGGMVGMAITGSATDMAFSSIDKIYSSRKRRR